MNDSRKEMTRKYKETRRDMGIYRIRNIANGKCFLGASRNLAARISRHRFELGVGSESIAGLQHDWNEHGAEAFEFAVVDVLEPPKDDPLYDPKGDLLALEAVWLEQEKPFGDRGYNKIRR